MRIEPAFFITRTLPTVNIEPIVLRWYPARVLSRTRCVNGYARSDLLTRCHTRVAEPAQMSGTNLRATRHRVVAALRRHLGTAKRW